MSHLISLRLAQTTNRTIKFSHSHYFFNVPKPFMAIFRSLKQSSIKCSEKILYISYILLPKFHWDINWSITKYLMVNVRLLIGELGNNIILKVVTWHALSTLIKRVRQLKKKKKTTWKRIQYKTVKYNRSCYQTIKLGVSLKHLF